MRRCESNVKGTENVDEAGGDRRRLTAVDGLVKAEARVRAGVDDHD
jgi:hypothetical protein